MKKSTQLGIVLLGMGCVVTSVSAATMVANTSDGYVTSGGVVGGLSDWEVRVGEYYAPGACSMVIAFQLPTLAAGEKFSTATLTDQLSNYNGTPAFNLDLYGLARVSSDPTILTSDYYAGTLDTTATLIQDNILTPASPIRSGVWPYSTFSTDTSGNTALAGFLNVIYANGANAGKYIFLRFSPDIASMPDGNNAYYVTSGNGGQSVENPTISYTLDAVPEPASLVMLSSASLLLLAQRKHR